MVANTNINYNINYIKKNILNTIKQIIFNWNGVIFGGFVRDHIISEYYTEIFKKNNNNNIHNIWNTNIDRETIARTLISDEIDVYIKNNQQSDKMIAEITKTILTKFGETNVAITKILLINKRDSFYLYIENPIINIYRYCYDILIGKIPYITNGVNITITIDVIISDEIVPFGRLDFLCNGFVMTEYNICLSNNTGTDLDNLGILEKKEIESKIMKDIVNFKADYCMKFPQITNINTRFAIKYNEQVCKSIENLANHKYKWEIRNLPIILVHPSKYNNICKHCCICFNALKKKDSKITIPYNMNEINNTDNIIGSYMHKNCFFQYIYKQLEDKKNKYNDMIDEELLKCPLQHHIKFNIDNIKNIIDRYLDKPLITN
jgi:hypothetical protein